MRPLALIQWVSIGFESLRGLENRSPGLIRDKSVDNFSSQSLNPAVMLMSSGIR
jgi:hypothetical protein